MNRIIVFGLMLFLISCAGSESNEEESSSESNSQETTVAPEFTSYTDTRDQKEYRVADINGAIWMADNMDFVQYYYLKGWGFPDGKNNEIIDGGYVCNEKVRGWYGSEDSKYFACPNGWRLPNYQEFENLIKYFNNDFKALFAPLDDANDCYNNAVDNKSGMEFYPHKYPHKENGYGCESNVYIEYWTSDVPFGMHAPVKSAKGKISDVIIRPICIRCIQDENYQPEEHRYEGYLQDIIFEKDGKSKLLFSDMQTYESRKQEFFLEKNSVDLSELYNQEVYEAYKEKDGLNTGLTQGINLPTIAKREFLKQACVVVWKPAVDSAGFAHPMITKFTLNGREIGVAKQVP